MGTVDWDGVANGSEYSVRDKAGLRASRDLPEPVDRALRVTLQLGPEPGAAWRSGLLDLSFADGEALLSMTREQAEVWRAIRGEG